MVPSYHLSIETPTPLILGVGVMFAGELKTIPNILNLFRNGIPNIIHVPMSLKETVAMEQSPSCRSAFQRPMAVWLRASTSNAPFITLRWRQLVCGDCLLYDA